MRVRIGLVALIVATAFAAPVLAGEPQPAAAVLIDATGSKGIPLESVHRYHCHDRLGPTTIRCFPTEAARDADLRLLDGVDTVAALEVVPPSTDVAPAATCQICAIVTWYEDANYGGASYTAYAAWPDLRVLGWNDAISSFKSRNAARPLWWEDINYGGLGVMWSSGAWVPYVGDYWNDRFSSVYNYCFGC